MKRLNMGTLCCIMRKEVRGNVLAPREFSKEFGNYPLTQENILHSMIALAYPADQLGTLQKPTPKTASLIFRNQQDLRQEWREMAQGEGAAETIRVNFTCHVAHRLDKGQKERILHSIQGLLRETPTDELPEHLTKHILFQYDEKREEQYGRVMAECIQWCFLAPNTEYREPAIPALRRKPYDLLSYDPYGSGGGYSKSRAIRIILREDRPDGIRTLYDGYNHERFLEYVLKNNIVIKEIDCSLSMIDMLCRACEGNPYRLKRVEAEDYGQARDFIFRHKQEFRTKKWWKASLPDMIYDGLSKEIWTAYAFYNEAGRIMAYLDYKIRTDGDFELGTQLTEEECRGQGLATGLINFMRLKFINACFFSGTYEENGGMRRIFEKLGFQETLFYDPETEKSSNRIQERLDPDYPEDEGKMTNSVYYHIRSIMEETRIGAILSDSETKTVAHEDGV